MARFNRRNQLIEDNALDEQFEETVQNPEPVVLFDSVDSFWISKVKNGTPFLLECFKAHLTALGWANKPELYEKGALHFGLKMEK